VSGRLTKYCSQLTADGSQIQAVAGGLPTAKNEKRNPPHSPFVKGGTRGIYQRRVTRRK